MIKLDYLTLGVVVSMASMLSALVMITVWHINKSERGLNMWAIAATIGAVTYMTMYFFPFLGVYTVLITNIGSLMAQIFLLEGVMQFRKYGRQSFRKKLIPFAFFFIVVITFFNKTDATTRYLLHDFASIIILSLSAFFLMRNTNGLERKVYSITAGADIMMILGFGYRWYLAYIGAFKDKNQDAFLAILFMIIVLWILGWTCGLVVAVNYNAQQRILEMASLDDLTGLANRRNLNETLKLMMYESNSTSQKFLVFMLDLNGFKNINDTYGHIFGDKILIMMTTAINEAIRDSDYAARLGGDEFVVIVKSKTDEKSINQIKNRIRNSIETIRFVDEKKVQLRISIGCAIYPDDGEIVEQILNHADKEMYEEKIEERPFSSVME